MKKETYFTKDGIDDRAESMVSAVYETVPRHLLTLNKKNTALIVLDMQEYFLSSVSHAFIPSADAITGRVISLIRECDRLGLPVIYTRHINTEYDLNMSGWWRDIIKSDNKYSKINDRILFKQFPVIDKNQYDAFFNTSLDADLKGNEVKQVIICGVMTHLCCESTARSAFMRGYDVLFPADGTATYNEEFHIASLRNLAHGFAHIVLIKKIIEKLENDE